MMHESQTHDVNSFLTLTYDPDHLPTDLSLDRDHVPDFIKRLRKKIHPRKVRYFQCGEYGSAGHRPHYHLALFGHGFPDRKKRTIRSGTPVFTSAELSGLWEHGHHEIGSLTFKSAAYIARYTTKKVTLSEYSTVAARKAHAEKYERASSHTGEIHLVEPEHATMSLKPGIGEPWFRQFWRDVYPQDLIVMNGKPMRPPRYYDRLLERSEPEMWQTVRRARQQTRDTENTTPERLRVSEVCKEAEVKLFQERELS